MHTKEKKYNRRFFLKSVLAGLSLATVFVWDKMISTDKKINQVKFVKIPFQNNKRISFSGNYIIINEEGKTKVLSSRCTHLGCKINESLDDKLLCPCHGSTFNLNGQPTKGPAIKPLEEKEFTLNESDNTITISV